MMTLCSACGTVVRVLGDVQQIAQLIGQESAFWPNGYVCPKCGGAAVGVEHETTELLSGEEGVTLFNLTPEEAHALHLGLGMPQERKCTHAMVESALLEGLGRWGLEVDGQSGRVYIKWLETQQGTRLYLGAGPFGAVVFRVRPKQSYADKVQDE